MIRAPQWWNYKLPLAMTSVFLLARIGGQALSTLLIPALLILMAGFASASFASILDDFMDLKQDMQCGKHTPIMRMSPNLRWIPLLVACCLLLCCAYLISNLTISVVCFLLIALVFLLYSVRPVRLKERGLLGVYSISLGEHLLPTLLACSLLCELTAMRCPLIWLGVLCLWSFAFGLRGIIWHQLSDVENDRISSCRTAGIVLGTEKLSRIGEFVVFPLETICLMLLLGACKSGFIWTSFALYLFVEWLFYRFLSSNPIIVRAEPNSRFVFFAFYQFVLPLSLLLESLCTDPAVLALVALFCFVFAAPIAYTLEQVLSLWKMRRQCFEELSGETTGSSSKKSDSFD